MIVVLFFINILIEDPHGSMMTVLSLFPLTSPVAMMMRLTIGGVPFWHLPAAVALLVITVLVIIRAVARIKGDFFERFIREDSPVRVKKRFGVAGDAYVDIGKGTFSLPQLPEKDAELRAVKDTELIDLAEELVDKVRTKMLPAVDKLTETAEEYRRLGEELRKPDGNLQQFLKRLNDLVETHGIRAALGDHARKVTVCSTKPVTGHLLSASGRVPR